MSQDQKISDQVVVFVLDGQRYAQRLEVVERVVRAVAVTPVPETPAFILGVINLAGRLLPVISLRRCLGLPDRPVRPADQFMITRTSQLTVALVVDEVEVLQVLTSARAVSPEDVLPGRGCRVRGLLKLEGDVILIYDLEQFFDLEDQERIRAAQSGSGPEETK